MVDGHEAFCMCVVSAVNWNEQYRALLPKGLELRGLGLIVPSGLAFNAWYPALSLYLGAEPYFSAAHCSVRAMPEVDG